MLSSTACNTKNRLSSFEASPASRSASLAVGCVCDATPSGSPTELVVAMGREGKHCAEVDATKNPHTAARAAKLQTDEGRAAYRKRKWIAEPPNGWIKSVLGLGQFSLRGLHSKRRGVAP